MQKLSEHFWSYEFECHCAECQKTSAWKAVPELVSALELLRMKLTIARGEEAPITIVSGYRCPKRNAVVGGAKNSQHLYGNAADIYVGGMNPGRLLKFIREVDNFRGVGIGPGITHVDVGQRVAKWMYGTDGLQIPWDDSNLTLWWGPGVLEA